MQRVFEFLYEDLQPLRPPEEPPAPNSPGAT